MRVVQFADCAKLVFLHQCFHNQKGTYMTLGTLLFLMLIVMIAVSAWFSHQDVKKGLKPYIGGYFVGYTQIQIAVVYTIHLLGLYDFEMFNNHTTMSLLCSAIISTVIGLLIIVRIKLGWLMLLVDVGIDFISVVTLTLFNLNADYSGLLIGITLAFLGFILLNCVYVANRWRRDLTPNNSWF